jgi:phytanoyl-CoA hydroxylase
MKKINDKLFQFGSQPTHEQIDFFNKHGILQFKGFIDKYTVGLFLQEIKQVEDELLTADVKK